MLLTASWIWLSLPRLRSRIPSINWLTMLCILPNCTKWRTWILLPSLYQVSLLQIIHFTTIFQFTQPKIEVKFQGVTSITIYKGDRRFWNDLFFFQIYALNNLYLLKNHNNNNYPHFRIRMRRNSYNNNGTILLYLGSNHFFTL